MKKANVNKKKIILILLILICVYPVSVLGRYTYKEVVNSVLHVKGFFFESEYLSVNNRKYTYSYWDGNGTTSIPIPLYSMKNSLQKTEYDLRYAMMCWVDEGDELIECALDSSFSTAMKSDGSIYATTNTATENIYIRAKSGVELKEGDIATINIIARGQRL